MGGQSCSVYSEGVAMRVYQVNVTGRFSTGEIAKAIHRALLTRGEEARFAFGNGGIVEEGMIQSNDIWHQRFDYRFQQLFGVEGVFCRKSTWKIIKDIKVFSPDIIHLHNIHGNYLDLKAFLTFLAAFDKPVLLTLHDCWPYTGGCYHYTVNCCGGWKENCSDCNFVRHGLWGCQRSQAELLKKKALFRGIKQLYVSTVSSWLEGEVRQSFLRGREITAICNGIDVEKFQPKVVSELRTKLGCEGKKMILGVASSWSDRKGLSQWRKLAKEIPTHYKIVLVGLNSDQIRSMPESVVALPRVTKQEELCDLYNAADIYINLSKEETFGLPTVEAMSCGTPVIVINSTANPEIITPKTGIVINDDSTESIQKAVETVLKRNANGDMSIACINHVKERYSSDVMTKKYLDCYYTILESSNKDKKR